MSRSFIQRGDVGTFTAPGGGVTAGTPLLIGTLVVVPQNTVAATLTFDGYIEGVCTCPKATGVAWTEGQVLYWDSAAGNFATAASATARRAGVAMVAAASGDATGVVRLNNISAVVNVA